MTNLTTTADDILASARSLIITAGYNGFSYADIADVVGIRKASIHHHFPTKADLVRILVQQYITDAEKGLTKLQQTTSSPLEHLRIYLGSWEECIRDASRPFCVCAMLASELPVLPDEISREVTTYFHVLSRWISGVLETGVGEGVFRLIDPPQVEAEAFMATVHGAMLSARAYDNPAMFQSIAGNLLKRIAA